MKNKERESGPISLASDIIRFEGGGMEEDEVIVLFQGLVDTGLAWQLQGFYGRTARDLINAGLVRMPGTRGDTVH